MRVTYVVTHRDCISPNERPARRTFRHNGSFVSKVAGLARAEAGNTLTPQMRL